MPVSELIVTGIMASAFPWTQARCADKCECTGDTEDMAAASNMHEFIVVNDMASMLINDPSMEQTFDLMQSQHVPIPWSAPPPASAASMEVHTLKDCPTNTPVNSPLVLPRPAPIDKQLSSALFGDHGQMLRLGISWIFLSGLFIL